MSCLTCHFLCVFLIALYPSLISCPSLVYLSPCLTCSLGQSVCFCPHVSPAPLICSLGLFFFPLGVARLCSSLCVLSVPGFCSPSLSASFLCFAFLVFLGFSFYCLFVASHLLPVFWIFSVFLFFLFCFLRPVLLSFISNLPVCIWVLTFGKTVTESLLSQRLPPGSTLAWKAMFSSTTESRHNYHDVAEYMRMTTLHPKKTTNYYSIIHLTASDTSFH